MQTTRRITATAALGLGIILVTGAGVATASGAKSLLLGKSNSAKAVTTLSNSKGTPLSLKAKAGKPPLAVNNKVLVPNLNSSLLGGKSASQFQSKINTTEECNLQPGSDVTGLNSAGFTCDNQQGVQNGKNPGGAPQLDVHDLGEYLIFANVTLQNSGTAAGNFVCSVIWQNTGPIAESADDTYVSLDAGQTESVALATSGAQQISSSTTLQLSCTTTSTNASVDMSGGGDLTALPVAFQ